MSFRFAAAVLPALLALSAQAQTQSNSAYAITSKQMGQQSWTEVKRVDLGTGNVIASAFESTKGQYDLFDGRSAKPIVLDDKDSLSGDKAPFAGLSAACAYDVKSNRLYFAPLFMNQLRYIDLSAKVPAVYIFDDQPFSGVKDAGIEANQMTRMAIGADGNGYALNNDASHLVRFTTGKIPVITDLGPLADAPENDTILVADPNTSWGGDMVSDASGNLYLVTAHNLVFRINLQTRMATYIQQIKGLTTGYTTNGAVVDAEGQLVLSSANSMTGYYKVDPSTWQAKLIVSNTQVYNTSDLANENLLFRTPAVAVNEDATEKVSVYPNPVKSGSFRVSFFNKTSGNYDVQLVDIAGRLVSDKTVNVFNSQQLADMKVDRSVTKGVYLVKVVSHDSKEVYSKKIIVE